MTIITKQLNPPIPTMACDWCAYVDGKEEGFVGFGPTEAEAKKDLEQQLENNDVI